MPSSFTPLFLALLAIIIYLSLPITANTNIGTSCPAVDPLLYLADIGLSKQPTTAAGHKPLFILEDAGGDDFFKLVMWDDDGVFKWAEDAGDEAHEESKEAEEVNKEKVEEYKEQYGGEEDKNEEVTKMSWNPEEVMEVMTD